MEIIKYIMVAFALIASIDRIFGNRLGLGKEFERGLMLTGASILSMTGMLVLAPLIAQLLTPFCDWFYDLCKIDPSVIPASLLANDMGGAATAEAVAKNETLRDFNAYVVSSMMGVTFSWTLPFGMTAVKAEKHNSMFLGFLCGVLTVPVGCFVAGLMCNIPLLTLLLSLLPLLLISMIITLGLLFFQKVTLFIFRIFGQFIRIVIVIGLAMGLFTLLTGVQIPLNLDTYENCALVSVNATAFMAGALPLLYCLSKVLKKALQKMGNMLGINETSAMGFVSTVATSMATFEMMDDMDNRGVILNSAFAISAGFVFAGHMAFTFTQCPDMVGPMIVGKLVSGFAAVAVAFLLFRNKKDADQ